MKKYIRTKKGKIHRLYSYQGWIGYYQCYDGNTYFGDFWKVRKTSVIAEADTIEELCDEFVIKTIDNGYLILGKYGYKHFEYKEKAQIMGVKIFGAIWTDKGLIYVAKMNELGELCLL